MATEPLTCQRCNGDGWYVDHDDDCYEEGQCVGCGGVQRQCDDCGGTGRLSGASAGSQEEGTDGD